MTFNKIILTLALGTALLGAAPAFAAPTFTTAGRGSGMAIADFKSALAAYNAKDVDALVNAKTVTIVPVSDAWSDTHQSDALDAISSHAQSIDLLHKGLEASKEAKALLSSHDIAVKDVIDVVADGMGGVTLYVM